MGMLTFPQASLLEKEGVHIQKGPCLSGQWPRAAQAGHKRLSRTGSLHRAAHCHFALSFPCRGSRLSIDHPFPSGLRVRWDVWGGSDFPPTHLCIPKAGQSTPMFSQWAQMNLLLPNNLILLPHGSDPSCDTHIPHCL